MHVEQMKSGKWAVCQVDGGIVEVHPTYASARWALRHILGLAVHRVLEKADRDIRRLKDEAKVDPDVLNKPMTF